MKRIKALLQIMAATTALAIPAISGAQLFPTVTLTPDPLEFHDVRVGSSESLTITATRGAGSIPVLIFASRLGNTEDFSIVSDLCSGTVLSNPGDSCAVRIGFAPPARGHYSTTFSLLTLSHDIIDSALVEGHGIAPEVTLSATTIDFGDQTVNKSSAAHQVTMLNTGNAALTIDSITSNAPFAVAGDCGGTLAARAACTLGVTFTPTAEQTYAGDVTIADDAADSPQTISLSGKGIAEGNPDASLSTHMIDFGNQLIGTTSEARTVTLKSVGTVDLTINAIIASADFTATGNCVSPLAPDAECGIDVTFTPPTSGGLTGTLLVDDDATDSPQSVNLSGTGVAHSGPKASLSTALINFGEVPINTTSAPQVVTITNIGDEDLVIEDVQFGGENPEYFDGVNNCNTDTLAPGRSCSGATTFSPKKKEVSTATITVTDNSPDSPQVIIMGGMGVHSSGGCSLLQGKK